MSVNNVKRYRAWFVSTGGGPKCRTEVITAVSHKDARREAGFMARHMEPRHKVQSVNLLTAKEYLDYINSEDF